MRFLSWTIPISQGCFPKYDDEYFDSLDEHSFLIDFVVIDETLKPMHLRLFIRHE